MNKEIENKMREVKPRDLNFREECGDYKCGASKSWEEGFTAASKIYEAKLEKILEECNGCKGLKELER